MPPTTCPIHPFRLLWLPRAPNQGRHISRAEGLVLIWPQLRGCSQIPFTLWGLCCRKEGWILIMNITALWGKQFTTQPSKGHCESSYRKGWRQGWAMPPGGWQWCRIKASGGSHQGFLPSQVAAMSWEGLWKGAEGLTPGPSIPGWKVYRENFMQKRDPQPPKCSFLSTDAWNFLPRGQYLLHYDQH